MVGLLLLYVELAVLVALAALLVFRGFRPIGLFSPAYLFEAPLSAELAAEAGRR